jgi:taurine--2-oxoglutarate transaminase
MTYGGLTITEPKAKLAQILNDITPAEITGFIFPLSGSEANECAFRAAMRYTGKTKILSRYKSYHGGTSGPLSATGDFRRQFAEA